MADTGHAPHSTGHPSPFLEIDRDNWAALAPSTPQPLSETEIVQLRGLGEPLDMTEVSEVYLPLSRLLNLYAAGAKRLHASTSDYLGDRQTATPFVIGVAGSVAVGKSTIARLLRELLARWSDTPRVELVATDGFLYPNAELTAAASCIARASPSRTTGVPCCGSSARSRAACPRCAPRSTRTSPTTSCRRRQIVVRQPDILIVEGLNVLQPPLPGQGLAVSDLFDFSIYVDARTSRHRDLVRRSLPGPQARERSRTRIRSSTATQS